MRMTVNVAGTDYRLDFSEAQDISIPVRFGGEGVAAFGTPPARKEAYCAGSFTGDVRKGGSCNCEVYTFSPHLHGTHTECIGHITAERMSACDVVKEAFMPATVITVTPKTGSWEVYTPPARETDKMITRSDLEKALAAENDFLTALVVRTLPNDDTKKNRDYSKEAPPFFSNDAMKYIASLGVRHLLVDFPSVDRPDDDGKLSNHRIFWDSPEKTITEMVYVRKNIADGHYILNLQVAAMEGDAASSRPLLFKVIKA